MTRTTPALLLLLTAACTAPVYPVPTENYPPPEIARQAVHLYESNLGWCSAMALDDHTLITAAHCARPGAVDTTVRDQDGVSYPVVQEQPWADADVMLVEVDPGVQPLVYWNDLPWAPPPAPGAPAWSIGFGGAGYGARHPVSHFGYYVGRDRLWVHPLDLYVLPSLTAGDSGSPVVNAAGMLVGVATRARGSNPKWAWAERVSP